MFIHLKCLDHHHMFIEAKQDRQFLFDIPADDISRQASNLFNTVRYN